jgi:hypothetical protein
MDWVNDVAEYGSKALDYLTENEWAANAVAGAATAGLNYLAAKEEQDFRREEADRAWDRKLHLSEAGTVDGEKYDWSDLANGGLTDGGLISQARKE